MRLRSAFGRRTAAAKRQFMAVMLIMGMIARVGWDGAQDYLAAHTPLEPTAKPSAYQLGIFMVLVFGAVALVVVSIVLLFGMDIAGEFADGIEVDNDYSEEANSTVNSTGNAFQLFGTSVLVIPAAAVLAVLIGGLIGAVTMVGGGALPGMGGNRRGGR